MTKILITGAEGRVGRSLTEALARSAPSMAPAFPPPYELFPLSHPRLDITQHAEVERAMHDVRPDLLLNAAGYTDIDLCEYNKWAAYLVNRDGVDHLAKVCAQRGVKMVHFSTDLVFDGARPIPYTEEDPPNPLSVYADTKLAGELTVMKHAPKHLLLRCGWLFGRQGSSYVTHVLEAVRSDEVIYGHDDHVGQPTSLDDLVRAVLGLLAKGCTGTYPVASQGEATEYDVAREVLNIIRPRGVEVKTLKQGSGGRSAMRPRYSVLDVTKLAAEGIAMPPWREAVRAYIQSVRGGDTKILR